jgi:hypothetical protein
VLNGYRKVDRWLQRESVSACVTMLLTAELQLAGIDLKYIISVMYIANNITNCFGYFTQPPGRPWVF